MARGEGAEAQNPKVGGLEVTLDNYLKAQPIAQELQMLKYQFEHDGLRTPQYLYKSKVVENCANAELREWPELFITIQQRIEHLTNKLAEL